MFSSARDTLLSPSPPPKRNYLCHLLLLLYWRPFDICGCRPFKNWIKKSSFWMAKCQMASFLSKSGQFNNRLDTFWPFKIWTSQEFRFVFTYFVHLHSNLFRLEPFGVDAKISFNCKRGSLQVRLCIFSAWWTVFRCSTFRWTRRCQGPSFLTKILLCSIQSSLHSGNQSG